MRITSRICGDYDIAIVINAVKSAVAVQESSTLHSEKPIVVVVTGTDLYQFGSSDALQESLRVAKRIVVSQPAMIDDLPTRYRSKCKVIFQSARALSRRRSAVPRNRSVVVCGHLRQVKDPFRTAMAVRRLPPSSQMIVHHYGAALHEPFAQRATAEMSRNDRYRWHGEVSRHTARRRLATAWLMVLSSKMEGGANVLSEAIAAGTPVLATRIPGNLGLLGKNYSGYFDVGDTKRLRELLLRCETDQAFYSALVDGVARQARLVDPRLEQQAWSDLLRSL